MALSVVAINIALVFYTIGVWSERVQATLKMWHALFFGLGLVCDAAGTYIMTQIAAENRAAGLSESGLTTLMAYSGTAALALMAIHLVWAVVVLIRNRPTELTTFHKFSVVVWAFWLVPYLAGAIGSMIG